MDLLETGSLWITYITCDVFIICLDSHSDGTHSLQRIYWRASDTRLISQNLFQWTNKLILDDLRVSTFSANFYFHFWVKYPFKSLLIQSEFGGCTLLFVLEQAEPSFGTSGIGSNSYFCECNTSYGFDKMIRSVQWCFFYYGTFVIFNIFFCSTHLSCWG